MSDEFASAVMRHVVTLLAYNVGWDASQTTALDILADIMRRHFLHLAKSTHNFAEFYGRTDPNLDDVALALSELNMSGAELEEYVQNFDPVTLNYAAKVPVFPVKRESKLNFLRPGSEEVLTRPVHVHEYMPPMIFVSFQHFIAFFIEKVSQYLPFHLFNPYFLWRIFHQFSFYYVNNILDVNYLY